MVVRRRGFDIFWTLGSQMAVRQILKPSGKRKAKKSFTVSDKTTLKGATGMARLRGSAS
jgi:hypothetical protein